MINDYSTIKVNDEVSVVRHGSWSARSEGVYVAAKVDKMKVVLKRKTDGYERIFSVKTQQEKGSNRYHTASIETIAEMEKREAAQAKDHAIRCGWKDLELAVSQKNLAAVGEALAHINSLQGK